MAGLGDGERIDLHHRRVEIAEGAVGTENRSHGLVDLRAGESEPERQLTRLERLHPDGRLHHLAEDRIGFGGGDLLDLHAAMRMGDDTDLLHPAVEHQPDVELAVERHRGLDIEPVDDFPRRPSLIGDERSPEQLLGRGADLIDRRAELDAARFPPSTGVNLGLHHPAIAADFFGAVHGLIRCVDHAAARHGHAEPREQLLGLVFVDVHRQPPTAAVVW